jgi:uncharacterized protein
MESNRISKLIERNIFQRRPAIIAFFAIVTIVMLYFASQLKVDAGFEKNVPLNHEYMQTYLKHQARFGGANRVMISVTDSTGDIFNPHFFNKLEEVTSKVSFIKGVDKSSISSLYTPNTRFIELTEEGFKGGPVIDADFAPTKEGLEKVRQNVLKAGIVGRLVSNDFSSAIISATLLEKDPITKEPLDYIRVANDLELMVRQEVEDDQISVQIIGFAKMIGDVSNGAKGVLIFFAIALAITAIIVYLYSHSLKLTVLPLFCSIVAVIWQLGLLNALGFGIDPMSILVPFLVFAIGVSHGVQMINAVGRDVALGLSCYQAAHGACCRLLIPGGIALISDTLGFLTLLLIEIDIIRELAMAASLGVAVIILTNLILLPVLLSYIKVKPKFIEKACKSQGKQDVIWKKLVAFSERRLAIPMIIFSIVIAAFGYQYASQLKIGDLHAGAPALHDDSRYNQDTAFIVDKYSIGVDIINVLVETEPDACTVHEVMNDIDRFQWRMLNVEGVQSTLSLPYVAKIYNAAYSEGYLKWRVLSRNPQVLAQASQRIPTSTGLLNDDCSVMPVMIFLEDHKAETIERVIAAVKSYQSEFKNDRLAYKLATGPVGVMAATNEAVAAAQTPMLVWVYAAVIFLCLISFRSIRGTLCVILPLALVSILAQALMTMLDIGLTVATLPVVALGVGVGVDYGIYIFSKMQAFIKSGQSVSEAYFNTLRLTGNAVILTGITLAIGVSTWIFSDLKFQADMGVLLTFMFLVNMLGAIFLLPSLAALLYPKAK